MITLNALTEYLNQLLECARVRDYCPNGLQIEGKPEVQLIVTGVTASQALIDQAIERGADALLVHHGYFWKGEDPCLVGIKGRRIRSLIESGMSLLAYHLPLDLHPELGNNAMIANHFGLEVEGGFYPLNGLDLAQYATLPAPMVLDTFLDWITGKLGRVPMVVGNGAEEISRIGWSSGASQDAIEAAAEIGLDLFISGEISERTTHLARELGIYYLAAGHHATERWGVEALGVRVERELSVQCEFIDIDNPV